MAELTWDTWEGTWNSQTATWDQGVIIPPPVNPPIDVYNWDIGNDLSDEFGFNLIVGYGLLDPSTAEGDIIQWSKVNQVSNLVSFQSTSSGVPRKLNGSETITLASGSNTVQLTWSDVSEQYEATDPTFTAYVVGADGTSVQLDITIDAPQTPTVPIITASGDSLVGVTAGARLLLLDPNATTEDILTVVERVSLPLLGHKQVTTLVRMYPHISGTEPLLITLGSQDYPNAPIRWKPGVIFDPSSGRKVDIRTTGELHCWRVESLGNGSWKLSGFDLEYETDGVR